MTVGEEGNGQKGVKGHEERETTPTTTKTTTVAHVTKEVEECLSERGKKIVGLVVVAVVIAVALLGRSAMSEILNR